MQRDLWLRHAGRVIPSVVRSTRCRFETLRSRKSFSISTLKVRGLSYQTTPNDTCMGHSTSSYESLVSRRHVCKTLAKGHAMLSTLFYEKLKRVQRSKGQLSELQGNSVFLELLDFLEQYVSESREVVHVPQNIYIIEDMAMFLSETLRAPLNMAKSRTKPNTPNRFMRMTDEGILDEFAEWVWGSSPPSSRASFDQVLSSTSDVVDETLGSIPFLDLMGLMQSYVRYHRGVLWGASLQSSDGAGEAKKQERASFYRRAYWLHPWHGLYCPEGRAEQNPYVYLLRWMLDTTPSAEDSSTELENRHLWRAHRAVESFSRPGRGLLAIQAGAEAPLRTFTALDVCSQSGFVVDLLLKAGAAHITAVDVQTTAQGNTEATVRENFAEKRSTTPCTVALRHCELLPSRNDTAQPRRPIPESPASGSGVYAEAAARRRQLARFQGRTFESTAETKTSHAAGLHGEDQIPFDLVWYHPPATKWWPLTMLLCMPPKKSVWWRHVEEGAHQLGAPAVLPWLHASSTWAGGMHPHATLHALHEVVRQLRDEAFRAQGKRAMSRGPGKVAPLSFPSEGLVAEGGYVAMVLPCAFEAREMAQRPLGPSESTHGLGDWVIAQLDGYYDVVLRRRCYAAGDDQAGTGPDNNSALPLLVRHALKAISFESQVGEIELRLREWLRQSSWVDLLVFKRPPAVSQSAPSRDRRVFPESYGKLPSLRGRPPERGRLACDETIAETAPRQPTAPGMKQTSSVKWEDSFERMEYKPKSFPGSRHHWTELVPSYSYLEDDFYESSGTHERNFLALGRTPEPRRELKQDVKPTRKSDNLSNPPSGLNGKSVWAMKAVENFQSVFSEELRTKRATKLRKLAFSPIEQQEWYIDQKLIRSEAAKVDFMNELTRWNFKDLD